MSDKELLFLLFDFLNQFYFILNASSDGWTVKYLGQNKYKFSRKKSEMSIILKGSSFIDNYTNKNIYKIYSMC